MVHHCYPSDPLMEATNKTIAISDGPSQSCDYFSNFFIWNIIFMGAISKRRRFQKPILE